MSRDSDPRMNAFLRLLIVTVVMIVIAAGAVWLHRARTFETEFATELEQNFRDLSAVRPDGTPHRTQRLIDALDVCIAHPPQAVFSRRELDARVEAARGLAISNLVASLEGYSGMHYGTNVGAWQDWLRIQLSGAQR